MNIATKLLAATALCCVIAAPAFAQDTEMSEKQILNFKDGHTIHVGSNGKMRMLKSNKDANAMMTSKGEVVPAGTVFHWSGGKMYMMHDKKMDDGKMLSDHYAPAGGA